MRYATKECHLCHALLPANLMSKFRSFELRKTDYHRRQSNGSFQKVGEFTRRSRETLWVCPECVVREQTASRKLGWWALLASGVGFVALVISEWLHPRAKPPVTPTVIEYSQPVETTSDTSAGAPPPEQSSSEVYLPTPVVAPEESAAEPVVAPTGEEEQTAPDPAETAVENSY